MTLIIPIAIASALLAGPGQAADSAGVDVRLLSITEVRHVVLEKPAQGEEAISFTFGDSPEPGLVLELELIGVVAGQATHYGHVTVKSAEDDTGHKLNPLKPRFSMNDAGSTFLKIDREHMYFGQGQVPQDRIKFDVKLELPNRAAKKLAMAAGSVKLRTGKRQDVLIAGPRQKIGTPLKDKALAAAGLKVEIVEPQPDGFLAPQDLSKAVVFRVSGKLETLLDASVVDAQGKELSSGSMSSTAGDAKTYVLEADESLPDDARLKLVVLLGQKDVEVPFKLADVPLP
ncbi:MAG: hypothetical protein KKB50_13445 [Planctomycetes bacterium]|nr:hypothetical protein [Planctomycetota bacterium]